MRKTLQLLAAALIGAATLAPASAQAHIGSRPHRHPHAVHRHHGFNRTYCSRVYVAPRTHYVGRGLYHRHPGHWTTVCRTRSVY